MPSSRVITELIWDDDAPQVRVHDDHAEASTLVPLLGLRLNYRADRSSPRRCLGHRKFTADGSVHVDCSAPPEPGARKCARCSVVDASFASNVHHAHTRGRGEIDAAYDAHLRKPNVLYLAAFRDGSLKVGTSTESRTHQRLGEQGAWSARIVARALDGYAVRVLEDEVTTQLALSQSVAVKRKLDGMVTPASDERLEIELDRHASLVAGLIDELQDERFTATSEAWSHPGATRQTWRHVHPYPLDLATGSHDLEVVDAVGRLVAVKRPDHDDVFVADLQRLYGLELELGDFVSDELAVQDSLF